MITQPLNPFVAHEIVEPSHFTARAEEVRKVRSALLFTPARLLVYGPRRMGKTSVLHAARRAAERRNAKVVLADCSTASSAADVTNRVLESACRALGREWSDLATSLVRRLRFHAELVPDPVSGLAVPAVGDSMRGRDAAAQLDSLLSVLGTLAECVAERNATFAVILDEFQQIHRSGGLEAEWRLRDAIQDHQHVSYVFAGSDSALIKEMTAPKRAFYGMFDVLDLGPIDLLHLARWIDQRFAAAGAPADGVGEMVVRTAAPRTRDVVRLARAAFEVLRGASPASERQTSLVRDALARVVAEEDDAMRMVWGNLTGVQQNVLRAVAWNGAGLAARATLRRFGLGHGGTARNTALALTDRGLLEPSATSVTGFGFDSPFVRAWVVRNTLPDIGLHVPIDHGP